jgi:hypothetical protein
MTRRVTLTLLLALGALLTDCGDKGKPASESAAESSGLKITAWNLQWFPGKTPKGETPEENAAHIAAVVSELKEIDVDIVLLQEIRDPAALQEIVKAIPEYSVDVASNFQGNLEVAILTRELGAQALAAGKKGSRQIEQIG